MDSEHRGLGVTLRQSLVKFIALILVSVVLASVQGCAKDEPSETSLAGSIDLYSAEQQAKDLAAAYGISNPPAVTVVRFVSAQEQPGLMVQCLEALGFTATISADGQGYEIDYPPGQLEPGHLAQYTCGAQYPVIPEQLSALSGNLSEGQLDRVFHYVTVTLVSCLEEQGIGIDPSTIPSRTTFQDGSSGLWNPYLSIDFSNMSAASNQSLQSKCPPNIPPQELFSN